MLEAIEDARSLLDAQRRKLVVGLGRGLLLGQTSDRAEFKLMRAWPFGKANDSLSRLTCALDLTPERTACASRLRARSFSAKRCLASSCPERMAIVKARVLAERTAVELLLPDRRAAQRMNRCRVASP